MRRRGSGSKSAQSADTTSIQGRRGTHCGLPGAWRHVPFSPPCDLNLPPPNAFSSARGRRRKPDVWRRGLGRHALVATGRDARRAGPLLEQLRESGVGATVFSIAGEPDLETIRRGAALARREGCDLVVSFGGGSVLDAGKAIAAMMTNEGDLLDYIEIIGRGRTLARPSAPFLAIPTTAGTGSEATRNAVLASPEHRVKVSLRSPFLLPVHRAGGPGIDPRSAARPDRQHRPGRADATDRTLHLPARQPDDRRAVRRRDAPRRPLLARRL